MTRILLVEDNDEHADIVTRVLTTRKGWTVVRALTVKEGLLHAALKPFDIAIVDYQLPDGDGLDLLDSLRAQKPGLPVVFLTAHGSEEVAMRAMSRGAADYVVKGPHYQKELPMRVQEVLARAEDLARVAAAVRHSGEVAPVAQRAAQPRPEPHPMDPKALARVLKTVVVRETVGAAVFDGTGRPLAVQMPDGLDAPGLGASVAAAVAQTQQALRRVPGAGPPRVMLVEYESGLLAAATLPGPSLVVLLFDASEDRGEAVRLAREAAQRVWEASRA